MMALVLTKLNQLTLTRTWMCAPNYTAIYQIVVEIFNCGPKWWWTNDHAASMAKQDQEFMQTCSGSVICNCNSGDCVDRLSLHTENVVTYGFHLQTFYPQKVQLTCLNFKIVNCKSATCHWIHRLQFHTLWADGGNLLKLSLMMFRCTGFVYIV